VQQENSWFTNPSRGTPRPSRSAPRGAAGPAVVAEVAHEVVTIFSLDFYYPRCCNDARRWRMASDLASLKGPPRVVVTSLYPPNSGRTMMPVLLHDTTLLRWWQCLLTLHPVGGNLVPRDCPLSAYGGDRHPALHCGSLEWSFALSVARARFVTCDGVLCRLGPVCSPDRSRVTISRWSGHCRAHCQQK